MITNIKSVLPICPVCNGALVKRRMLMEICFYCPDCKTIFKVLGQGEHDDEVKVSDYNIKVETDE